MPQRHIIRWYNRCPDFRTNQNLSPDILDFLCISLPVPPKLFIDHLHCTMLSCLVALTLCNPMDYSPPGSSIHGDSPGKNAGVGCHALLQGIIPTQGSNAGLLHCRRILHHLGYQGSP